MMEYTITFAALLILLTTMLLLTGVAINNLITARRLYNQLKEDFEYYKRHGTGEV